MKQQKMIKLAARKNTPETSIYTEVHTKPGHWPGGNRWLPPDRSHRSVRAHINAYGSSV